MLLCVGMSLNGFVDDVVCCVRVGCAGWFVVFVIVLLVFIVLYCIDVLCWVD